MLLAYAIAGALLRNGARQGERDGARHRKRASCMTTLLSDQVSDQVNGVRDTSPEAALERDWATNPRWAGITRPYRAADVTRLRGSIQIEHTLARLGAERLWQLLQKELYVAALGALTGNPAVHQLKPRIKAIYLSGWQVAA